MTSHETSNDPSQHVTQAHTTDLTYRYHMLRDAHKRNVNFLNNVLGIVTHSQYDPSAIRKYALYSKELTRLTNIQNDNLPFASGDSLSIFNMGYCFRSGALMRAAEGAHFQCEFDRLVLKPHYIYGVPSYSSVPPTSLHMSVLSLAEVTAEGVALNTFTATPLDSISVPLHGEKLVLKQHHTLKI